MNSSIECSLNMANTPSTGWKWRQQCSRKHFRHRKFAQLKLWLGKFQREWRRLWGRRWIRGSARQLLRGTRILWAAGCVCRSKCSRIDLANTEVKAKDWNKVGDGQCDWNKEDQEKQKNVGQNGTICFQQVLYVAWPRISLTVIWGVTIDQWCLNVSW